MPEGLKIVISGDVTQAQAALKKVAQDAKATGSSVEKSFGKSSLPLTKGLQETSKTLKQVTPQVGQLSQSIETLRAKILARKDFLLRETDINKIKIYNAEIRQLQGQMIKLQTVGSSSMGAIGTAGTKAFSALRTAALVLPGIGIAGIFSGLFNIISGIGGAADETAKKLKELIVPIEGIRDAAGAGVQEEISKVTALSNAVLNQSLSYKERNAALNQLKEINKGYFGDLTVEKAELGLLKTAVDEYTNALISVAVVKAFSDEIGKLNIELVKQEREFNKTSKAVIDHKKKLETLNDVEFFAQNIELKDATANYKDQAKVVGKLRGQMFELRTAMQEAVNASLQFKPLDQKEGPKVKDNTKDIIAEAKRVADFLKDAFVITYQFSPLDSTEVARAKAQSFLNKVSKGDLELLVRVGLTFDTPPNETEIIKDIKSDLERLDPGGILLPSRIEPPEPFDPSLIRSMQDYADEIKRAGEEQAKLNAQSNFLAGTIGGVLNPAFDGLFQAIKDGENPIKGFLEGIGQAVIQLIQKLIQAAALAAILSAILPGGVGGAKGFGAIFGKLLGLQGGGLVTGPTLAAIGEGSGTSLSNPEVVAPLDQLKQMLEGVGGGQRVQVSVDGIVRGDRMQLVLARTSRKRGRLG